MTEQEFNELLQKTVRQQRSSLKTPEELGISSSNSLESSIVGALGDIGITPDEPYRPGRGIPSFQKSAAQAIENISTPEQQAAFDEGKQSVKDETLLGRAENAAKGAYETGKQVLETGARGVSNLADFATGQKDRLDKFFTDVIAPVVLDEENYKLYEQQRNSERSSEQLTGTERLQKGAMGAAQTGGALLQAVPAVGLTNVAAGAAFGAFQPEVEKALQNPETAQKVQKVMGLATSIRDAYKDYAGVSEEDANALAYSALSALEAKGFEGIGKLAQKAAPIASRGLSAVGETVSDIAPKVGKAISEIQQGVKTTARNVALGAGAGYGTSELLGGDGTIGAEIGAGLAFAPTAISALGKGAKSTAKKIGNIYDTAMEIYQPGRAETKAMMATKEAEKIAQEIFQPSPAVAQKFPKMLDDVRSMADVITKAKNFDELESQLTSLQNKAGRQAQEAIEPFKNKQVLVEDVFKKVGEKANTLATDFQTQKQADKFMEVIDKELANMKPLGYKLTVGQAQERKKALNKLLATFFKKSEDQMTDLELAELHALNLLRRGYMDVVAKAVPKVAPINELYGSLATTIPMAQRMAIRSGNVLTPRGIQAILEHTPLIRFLFKILRGQIPVDDALLSRARSVEQELEKLTSMIEKSRGTAKEAATIKEQADKVKESLESIKITK